MGISWRRAAFVAALAAFALPSVAQTTVHFTQPVDLRYAWLGNDAKGSVDFNQKVLSLVNAATSSIDVCFFSFGGDPASGVPAIGDALAAKAASGIPVRIIINGGQRTGPGLLAAMKGPVQVIDDNFAALHRSSTGAAARINFQRPGGTNPAGWLTDQGQVFGPRAGTGFSYGWTTDVSGSMRSTTDAAYTSSLLGHCYANQNSDGPRTWEIEVPNGHYYVHLVVGQPTYTSKAFIRVEGEAVFASGSPTFFERADCGFGEFKGAMVSGGTQDDGTTPQSKRIHVTDGRLSVMVGKAGELAWSSLCYIEIFRASSAVGEETGDTFGDATLVQRSGIQHSKFLVIDGARLWTGSANLTKGAKPGPDGRSEDAIETTHGPLIAPFITEFNTMWGGPGPLPNVASARFSRFKTSPRNVTVSVPSSVPPGANPWEVWFSPSIGSADISARLETQIESGRDMILLMEQFTTGGSEFGFDSSGRLMNPVIRDRINAGRRFWAVIGNSDGSDPIFSAYSGLGAPGQVFVRQRADSPTTYGMHNKFLLTDALRDTRFRRQGKVVMGAMNWSKSGMLYNDEQTLFINDAAVANQYLQRAMHELRDIGMPMDSRADIVLVLDRSYSMNALCPDGVTSRFDASKMAAKLFIDMIEPGAGHRLGLVRFGSAVEPFTPVMDLREVDSAWASAAKSAIDGTTTSLPIGAATCYGAALQAASAQFAAVGTLRPRRLVHFFTDGMENRAPMAAAVYPGLITSFASEIHSTAFDDAAPFGTPGAPSAVLDEMATASGGTFAQVSDLSPVSLQKRFVEVARDAIDYDTLLDPTFVLRGGKRGATQAVEVDSTAQAVKFIAMWGRPSGPGVTMSITTPWGAALTPTSPGVRVTENPGSVVWHVDLRAVESAFGRPAFGTYTVFMAAPDAPREGVSVDLMVIADTSVDLRAEFVPGVKGGRGAMLVRALREGVAMPRGKIVIDWHAPGEKMRQVRLRDDGRSGDGAANDGLFGAWVEPKASGVHRFRVVAELPTREPRLGARVQRREATVSYTVPLDKPFEGRPPEEPVGRPGGIERPGELVSPAGVLSPR